MSGTNNALVEIVFPDSRLFEDGLGLLELGANLCDADNFKNHTI